MVDEKEDEIDDEEEEDDYGEEDPAQDIEEDAEYNDTIRIEGVLTGEEWLIKEFLLP